jgi:hypothetical protein
LVWAIILSVHRVSVSLEEEGGATQTRYPPSTGEESINPTYMSASTRMDVKGGDMEDTRDL